jgi:outer membrane receptor protein involved in Fe transport
MRVWFLAGALCFFSINSYADGSTPTTQLNEVDVIGQLDQARNSIQPSLGATDFNITSDQIDDDSRGDNTSFDQVILRAPGVAEDQWEQVHVRGEHANLQYRINGVLLPEGLTGFGAELDPRFVSNVSLIDGTLPAQYGFHTAGIVDITTKSGAFENGGDISMYGGSNGEVNPSLSYGGSAPGGINYFTTGSYLGDDLGIDNTTGSTSAIHDQTQQGKMFAYISKVIDDESRVSVMLGASHSDFQIPNASGGTLFNDGAGIPLPLPNESSQDVNDRQVEQNFYAVAAYQKSEDKLNYQLSAFTRFSEVNYLPDPIGDLEYNGVASTINDSIFTNGLEFDSSYALNEQHTLRAGAMFTISDAINESNSLVFPEDPTTGAVNGPEESINANNQKQGEDYGLYLQDEWKATEKLTINYGARFDQSYQYLNESQLSPRINAVYEFDPATKVHAGYARYFTPPPLEEQQNFNPSIFNNTTNATAVVTNSPDLAERANYYDAGITHNFLPGLQAGLDGYFKTAVDQLDDGQFNAAPIVTPFNYKYGQVSGIELTTNYKNGGFSSYANAAWSHALGEQWISDQFQFSQADLNYVADHWIYLDHDQALTVSSGVAYEFQNTGYSALNNTKVYADLLFGSGLRQSGLDGDTNIPNGKRVGSYNPINLGIEHTFKINNKSDIKVRFDIVNVADEVYELRSGSGVGVFAPSYGPRRGFYGGFSMDF